MSDRTTVINPQYEHLRDFVSQIPAIFEHEGRCIYDKRNRVKVFEHNSLKINVKRYCIPPYFFNRIVYNAVRKPKAMRAYEFAFRLLKMGIDTPMPIAYIIERNGAMLSYSYLVTVQREYIADVAYLEKITEPSIEDQKVLNDFGLYTAKLHRAGVYHKDYQANNVLYTRRDDHPHFILIDINRMDFGELSMKRCQTNFARLDLPERSLQIVFEAYCKSRKLEAEPFIKGIMKARQRYAKKLEMKMLIKRKA